MRITLKNKKVIYKKKFKKWKNHQKFLYEYKRLIKNRKVFEYYPFTYLWDYASTFQLAFVGSEESPSMSI